MSPQTSPLKARDINTSAPSPTKQFSKPAPATMTTTTTAAATSHASENDGQKPKSMEYHRQILQSRLEEDKNKHTYVSPSDMIMSPATQKLEALKGKRFGKAKGQSLFANTMSKNVGAGKDGEGGGGGSVAAESINAREGEKK
ncbi:MAG: hypothetical protein LQ345_002959 [Seirophora villosa]|nr:MAG: hypothetical protein LQ345_002959 [Seirophora villosa]